MTVPAMDSEKIDFHKELFELTHLLEGTSYDSLLEWGRSIAARVEESTIKRCEYFMEYDPPFDSEPMKRLYSSAQDGGK